jgi:HK97 family phage portal protein
LALFSNPFRKRTKAAKQEERALDVSSVSYPLRYGPSVVNEAVEFEAVRLAPVFAAGRLLASSCAGLPLEEFVNRGNSRVRTQLSRLFANPSATGTAYDWIYRAVISLAFTGNAIGVVTERDYLEYPTKVEWLKPELVYVQDSLPTLGERGSFTDPIFTYMGHELPREDVVHIPWFTMPGRVWGLSPLGAYASSVGIGLDAMQYKSDWFKGGGIPPGQFQNKEQTVNQADAQAIKSRIVQAIRSHEPLVYGNDWSYEPFTIPHSDAQFVETMRLTATQIAVVYGIPPEMIGGETGKSMTYHNVEQHGINFVSFSLRGWLDKLEAAFSQLTPNGHTVQFNPDGLIKMDSLARFQIYEIQRNIGYANINEIRAKEDEPLISEDMGNDYTPLQVMVQEGRAGTLDEDPIGTLKPDKPGTPTQEPPTNTPSEEGN